MRSILWVLLLGSAPLSGQETAPSPVGNKAKLLKLASGFSFTEGPSADKQGNIYFTDQDNNKILKWSVEGELSVFSDQSGRANGLCFDQHGMLWACSDQNNEIWCFDAKGQPTIYLTDGYLNKKLNGPNDLWVTPDGTIYFTDPYYKRDWWNHAREDQQNTQQVYGFKPGSRELTRLTDDLLQPNGIVGSPDGKYLYIADIQDGKTWKYTIQPDGTLGEKMLFAEMGSDGMTMDEKGNLYLTGNGVTIFNPKGIKIAHIPVEARWTSNVAFGGKRRNLLFITATESIYQLEMNVRGVK